MWNNDIETVVLARIKKNGEILKKQFPEIVFTNESESSSEARFPTVYLEELASTEQGRDLDGISLNAYLSTFQITISHNDRREHVKRVMNNCMETMKGMRFEFVGTPTYYRSNGVWVGTARFRRLIGSAENL